eukprot:PLAT11635.19.p1 GENE.PLAT11635.19~~PLAT11635.19.p1  ORF type:complete len:343 (+),score=123.70 PLAT11635.19:2-1030(+)
MLFNGMVLMMMGFVAWVLFQFLSDLGIALGVVGLLLVSLSMMGLVVLRVQRRSLSLAYLLLLAMSLLATGGIAATRVVQPATLAVPTRVLEAEWASVAAESWTELDVRMEMSQLQSRLGCCGFTGPLDAPIDECQANATLSGPQATPGCAVGVTDETEGRIMFMAGLFAAISALELLAAMTIVAIAVARRCCHDAAPTAVRPLLMRHATLQLHERSVAFYRQRHVQEAARKLQHWWRRSSMTRFATPFREYMVWRRAKTTRTVLSVFAYTCVMLVLLTATYFDLLYGVVFPPEKAQCWMASSFSTLALDIVIQQPIVISVTVLVRELVASMTRTLKRALGTS